MVALFIDYLYLFNINTAIYYVSIFILQYLSVNLLKIHALINQV
jgi:hypothetical protein